MCPVLFSRLLPLNTELLRLHIELKMITKLGRKNSEFRQDKTHGIGIEY